MVPFTEANRIADRFLALLDRLNIHPTNKFEDELLSVAQLLEHVKSPNCRVPSDVTILRAAAGLHDLASKVLAAENIAEFDGFVPHLRLIGENGVRPASLGQIQHSDIRDDTARKIAELYIGCIVSFFASDVVVDSPTNAKGDNPDVIFTLSPNDGKDASLWTIAIKTITSRNGQTIFERILDGANQINSPKCAVDFGLVLINAKNAIDHDALWSVIYKDLTFAVTDLYSQLFALAEAASLNRSDRDWKDAMGAKAVSPVLYLGQSLVRIQMANGDTVPTSVKMILPYPVSGSMNPLGYLIAYQMNFFMQTVIHGNPGTLGVLPT